MSHARLFRAAHLLMPIDRLRALLGFFPEPGALPDEVAQALEAQAEHFLRGGGSLTLAEWNDLTIPERAALSVAGMRLRAEQAATTGLASTSPAAALSVHGILDGGRAAAAAVNHGALEEAAATIAKARGATPVR